MSKTDFDIELRSIKDKLFEALRKAQMDLEIMFQELTDERDSDRLEKSGKETP